MVQTCFSYDSPKRLARWIHLKRRVKQALPADLRRVQAYNVGLERTGTSYIAQLFSKYRTMHEPDIHSLLPFILNSESPTVTWFRSRDRALRLEVESSHLLGLFAKNLVRAFPESKFICTAREPVSWVQSVWRWSYPDGPGTRARTRPNPAESWEAWHKILRTYYGGYDHQSEILKECNLYALRGYFSKYKSHYRGILESVPEDRLLIVRTSVLSEETQRIARFLGVESSTLTPPPRPVNQSKADTAPFNNISESQIRSAANKYCTDVWRRLLDKSKKF
jgi:hypothetical protein